MASLIRECISKMLFTEEEDRASGAPSLHRRLIRALADYRKACFTEEVQS